MKHLIRNIATREYFDHGGWTPDVAQAQKFPNPLSAISFTIRNNLKNAELVVVFGKKLSPKDIHFALSAY